MIWGRGAGVFLYRYSFCIGLLISKLGNIKILKTHKDIILSSIAFVAFLSMMILYNSIYSNFSYFIYAMSMPILLIILVELKIMKTDNKLINYFGKISFELYLWEWFLLSIRNDLFSAFNVKLLVNLCTFILCIGISQMYSKLFVNPFLDFIFSGDRKKHNSFSLLFYKNEILFKIM